MGRGEIVSVGRGKSVSGRGESVSVGGCSIAKASVATADAISAGLLGF